MKKSKKLAASLLVFLLILTACGGTSTNIGGGGDSNSPTPQASNKEAAPENTPSAEPQAPAALGETEWSRNAGLDKYESPEELYEQAKNAAGGKIVVYSTSGRINDIQKTFEAKYEGLKLEIFDLKSNVIMDKVIREQEAGLYNADLVLTKEVGGAVQEEMVKEGMLHKYIPPDILETLHEPWRSKALAYVPYMGFRTLYYSKAHHDSPPIDNWWDLTEPEWKDRIYMADPLQSPNQMDVFITFVAYADEMAEAYKEKYGKEIELNGTENAGYEFIQRFVKNVIVVKSASDGMAAVGKAPLDKPAPLAIATIGDMRKLDDNGWNADVIWDLKPRMSPVDEGLVFIAEKAPNVAGAKLLLRWIAGEADGKGEGLAPFSEIGSWMIRKGAPNPNPRPIEKLNVWPYDSEKMYQYQEDVVNFWIKHSS